MIIIYIIGIICGIINTVTHFKDKTPAWSIFWFALTILIIYGMKI